MECSDGHETRGEDGGVEADIRQLLAEAQEIAEYAGWAIDGVRLAPDIREALWRRSDAFRDLAEELRAIIRGVQPDVGF